MAVNIDKLSQMAEPRSEASTVKARRRKANREWLRMSQEIALCLHYYLREKGMSQKALAQELCVSPAYVAKLLKGTENLTLETISKLQAALGETFLNIATPYMPRMTITMSVKPVVLSKDTICSTKYIRKATMSNDYVSVGQTEDIA